MLALMSTHIYINILNSVLIQNEFFIHEMLLVTSQFHYYNVAKRTEFLGGSVGGIH